MPFGALVVHSMFANIEAHLIMLIERYQQRDWNLLLRSTLELFERASLELIDIVFGPRQLIKQLLLIAALQTSVMTAGALVSTVSYIYLSLTKKGRAYREIKMKMDKSASYYEWINYANQIDKINGCDKWRQEEKCSLYDCNVLKRRISDIQRMLSQRDVFTLIFRLRSGLSRDQFGIQHAGLFNVAIAGTKHRIEEYQRTVCEALDFICDSEDAEVPTDAKLAFFNETRHAYGRTALLVRYF